MEKLESTCQLLSFPMLKGFPDVFINLFHKKWASGFEFPLHCPASYAEEIHFTSLVITPRLRTRLSTAFGLSCFMKSVPNHLGFGVQFEGLLKDSFSESSNFNNFFLGADSRSSTLICIISLIAQNLGIVTHLQIWKLLAETLPPPATWRMQDTKPGFLT